eukprot:gene27730-34234_t
MPAETRAGKRKAAAREAEKATCTWQFYCYGSWHDFSGEANAWLHAARDSNSPEVVEETWEMILGQPPQKKSSERTLRLAAPGVEDPKWVRSYDPDCRLEWNLESRYRGSYIVQASLVKRLKCL